MQETILFLKNVAVGLSSLTFLKLISLSHFSFLVSFPSRFYLKDSQKG